MRPDGRTRIGLLLLGLILVGFLTGAVAAQRSYIEDVRITDVTDDDGDGYVSGFSIRISADTECVGCNDESSDSPDIEPYFELLVERDEEFEDVGGTDVVRNDPDFETTIVYARQPGAALGEVGRRSLRIRVELWDADPVFSERLDRRTVVVNVETPEQDVNHPPTATFTFDSRGGERGPSVVFDASASSDPDAPLEAYRWDLDGDGEVDATGRVVRREFDRTGERTVRLEVVDAAGATDAVERTVSITPDTDGDFLVDASDPFPNSRALPLVPVGAIGAVVVLFGSYRVLGWMRTVASSRPSTTVAPGASSESVDDEGTSGDRSGTRIYPGGDDTETRVYDSRNENRSEIRSTDTNVFKVSDRDCTRCGADLSGARLHEFCPECGKKPRK